MSFLRSVQFSDGRPFMKNIQPSDIRLDDTVINQKKKKYMDLKLWRFALQKPVKEHDKRVWDSFDVIAKWLISTRATVTQLTLMAGVISGLLALRDGYFDFLPWLAMTLGIYFAHSSENLVNDYIDFTRGIDEDNYYRGQYGIHPLVHKFWTKQDWARWFLTAGGISGLCGLFVFFFTWFLPPFFGCLLFCV